MVTGERQAARIRSLYLKTLLGQDISFFDTQTSTGEVIGRMSGDTVLIQEAIGEKVGKFIQLSSTFLGGFVIAFTRGWFLSLILLVCIPPVVLAGASMSLIISKLSTKSQLAYSQAGNVVEQTVGSIRTVVSFNGEKDAIKKYDLYLKSAYLSTVHQGVVTGLGIGSVMLFIYSSYGLAVWYGSQLIIQKGYNGGTVISIIMALMTGSVSLGQTSPCINAFASGQAAAYKMFKTIYKRPLIDSNNPNGLIIPNIKGEIELKNIDFSYPSRPDQIIFKNFSLKVPAGIVMALVGESGSGKSTIISLIERFYDPKNGQVLIDGFNLKEIRLSWIRERIGLVSQEPVLFNTSIRDNILFGNKNKTKVDIIRAIEMANADKFINKLPQGLDTMVGEQGTQLSGGQKQRIAISRAILKNPRILLLDEATSALDSKSEKAVHDALSNLMMDRTTVVVAHRLSTIKSADVISVLKHGKLIEQGSHAELIENPEGPYSQLIKLQEVKTQKDEQSPIPRSTSSSDRSISQVSSHNSSNKTLSVQDTQISNNSTQNSRKEVPISRLLSLNRPESRILILGSCISAITGIIMPVFGVLLSMTIKLFYGDKHELKSEAKFWALIYVFLGSVYFCALPITYYLFGVAGGKLVERIRSLCFKRILYQEISWFDDPENSSGAIGARLSGDAASIRGLVGDSLSLMVQNSSTVLAGLIIAMVANWKLAFIVVCVLPCVGAQGFAHVKFLKGFSVDAKKKYEEASTVANDAVKSIRTVASFCGESQVIQSYEKKCDSTVKHGIRQGLLSGLGYGFSYMLLYSSYALCFYVGARFVRDGSATFTQVFRVFFALTLAATGVSQSSAFAPDLNKAKDSASSIFEILDRDSKIDSSKDQGTEIMNLKGDIEFHNVRFRYPTRLDVGIFRNLCLKIPAGKTIALVGESGSGKSTIISLLQRFYEPDSGWISIDNIDLKSVNLNWLRQQIGLVGQEPALFTGTIFSNIAYGKQGEVWPGEIVEASKAANAHGFISSLRDGYNTSVGERGVQLSGGQKQRIAIARAILKNPKILLLDEATSALDAKSERIVQEALEKVMVGRTSVVVAHRLSTVKNADEIVVMEEGVVVKERGRHEDLIRVEGGKYAALVALNECS